MTGRENEFYWRPPISHRTCQLQTVHRAGHVYVGKNDADVFPRLQNGNGVIGVGGFYRSVTGRLHQIDRMHPTKNLVLNDENIRS